jgi:uncharacterized protein YbbK (DUF523 family)
MRENCFTLRHVALTLEAKNQWLSLIEWIPVLLKTRGPACGQKNVDDAKNQVSKQEKDQ